MDTFDPARAAWLVRTVAETLRDGVLPGTEGPAAWRVTQCVEILAAVGEQLTAAPTPAGDRETETVGLEAATARLRAFTVPRASTERADAAPPGLDPVAVEQALRARPEGGADLRVVRLDRIDGGRSKTTAALFLQGAATLPDEVILRVDKETALTGTSVVDEWALLAMLHRAGLRVPQPYAVERDPAPIGAPYLLLERVRGGSAGDVFEPPRSEGLALQIAEQLGRLHAMPITPEDREWLRGGVEVGRDSVRPQLDGIAESLTRGLGSPGVAEAVEWMYATIDRVSGASCLVHGDLGFHNLLVDGEELTAVLDWEVAALDHPARDLGYVRATIDEMIDWERFLEVYHAAGGPRVEPVLVDFYAVLSTAWLLEHITRASATRLAADARRIEYAATAAILAPKARLRLLRHLDRIRGGQRVRT